MFFGDGFQVISLVVSRAILIVDVMAQTTDFDEDRRADAGRPITVRQTFSDVLGIASKTRGMRRSERDRQDFDRKCPINRTFSDSA